MSDAVFAGATLDPTEMLAAGSAESSIRLTMDLGRTSGRPGIVLALP